MVDWKKEYKTSDLFKRDKAPEGREAGTDQTEPEAAADEPATSLLKKEIHLFGGKKKAPKAPKEPKPAKAPRVEGDDVPWYKKEVSLKRKPVREPLPESPPLPLISQASLHPVQLPAVEPEVVPVAELPEPEPAPVANLQPEPEPEPVVRALPELAPEPQPQPQPAVQIVPEPQLPEPVAEVAPEPARPVSWIDAVLEAPDPEPAFATPAPPAQPEPAVEALPEPEPVAVPEPEPVAGVAQPEPREVHPPVTAAELPPLEDDEERSSVPWYKRELSLGRKSKQKEPFELDAPTVPFWKKQLSLGRRAKQAAPAVEPVAVEAEASVAAEKSVPFWKKELSLGRGSKQKAPKAAKVPKEPKPEQAKREKPASVPFWKKGISMPSLSLPQRSGGGSRSGAVPKQLVGLKIGASQLAAARVANNGHAEVLQVARGPLDQGVIVGGELRDPDALAEALKEFFRRNKLPKKGVRLGIANNRIGVRTFEIAGIDDTKQLANAIRFRAQEALPIPIEEAVLDYQVLEDGVNDEGEQVRRILLVVAYRELVDRYVTACRKAGIALVGIDLEAFALLRALAAPREEESGKAAVVAVAVGHDRSTFAVSDGRVCEFTRVLEWGGQNLNVAIARALDLTPSEAEPIKHVLSLEGGPTPDGVSDEQIAAAREATIRQVNTFARELVSSLQFYQSQPGSLGIGEIILTGGTAHLVGFASELQRLIGVKVRIGDPLVRVKVSKRFREPEQIGSLAVAIGLGIED